MALEPAGTARMHGDLPAGIRTRNCPPAWVTHAASARERGTGCHNLSSRSALRKQTASRSASLKGAFLSFGGADVSSRAPQAPMHFPDAGRPVFISRDAKLEAHDKREQG